MVDYEYDVFISYRRSDAEWVRWTRDNFTRALTSLLRVRLGAVRVFFDETMECGTSWPHHLARSLARSRIIVPVLSRDYFTSEWCRIELGLMHHREKSLGLRNTCQPFGLIVPVTIDDGQCFPAEIQAIKSEKLHSFANPFMTTGSHRQEELAEAMRGGLCSSIERSLDVAPAFDPEWEQLASAQFTEAFRIQTQSQKTLPSLLLL